MDKEISKIIANKEEYIKSNSDVYEELQSMDYDKNNIPEILNELTNEELYDLATRCIKRAKESQDKLSREMFTRLSMFCMLGLNDNDCTKKTK